MAQVKARIWPRLAYLFQLRSTKPHPPKTDELFRALSTGFWRAPAILSRASLSHTQTLLSLSLSLADQAFRAPSTGMWRAPEMDLRDLSIRKSQTMNPSTPYTPHLTPSTLHPIPYTLHPKPDTLNATPYTFHSTPCTLHPTPSTLNP